MNRPIRKASCLVGLCLVALFLTANPAQRAVADNGAHLALGRAIGDQLRQDHYQARQRREGTKKESSGGQAVLPQLGYGPASGFVLGLQYTNRNLGPRHLLLDVSGFYATEGQQEYNIKLLAPRLFTDRFLGLVELRYKSDPARDFFALGNNDVGSDELSTNGIQRTSALFKLGWRVTPDLVIAAGLGLEHVGVRRGHHQDATPFTQDRFPDLVGLGGGFVNPVSVSLIYNTRHDVTRPVQGFNIIGKIQQVGPELGNDYTFTRYVVDASYLFPLFTPRQVIAVRLDGQYTTGGARSLPFFAMPALGGVDTLRGFYPARFLGHSRVLFNVEDRIKLADFPFFDLYKRVRIDGVVFAGAGRSFASNTQLKQDYGTSSLAGIPSSTSNAIRISYGVGTRIALEEALVARIDVGFSSDETGQVFLTFGQTF